MNQDCIRKQCASQLMLVGLSFILSSWMSCTQAENQALPPGLPLPPFTPDDAQLMANFARDGITALEPASNESADLIALGEALFYDKILSGDQNISCATCHHPGLATADALSLSIGAGGSGSGIDRALGSGTLIARQAPVLFNLAAEHTDQLFWDGRVSRDAVSGALQTPESDLNGDSPVRADIAAQLRSALAAQAMFPVTSDTEMRGEPGNAIRDAADNQAVWAALMARLVGTGNGTVGGIAEYRTLFQNAYPDVSDFDDFNFGHAARAIAAYEVAVFSATNTPLDLYLHGDLNALNPAQKRGAGVFTGPGRCSQCHNGPLLSDQQFHGIAAPQLGPGVSGGDDLGRFEESGNTNDRYEFRTPSLRNVALSAPYTHAGAYTSLAAVVNHYSNPTAALFNYDPSQLSHSEFQSSVDTDLSRNQARLDARDRRLRRPLNLPAGAQADLIAFLHALTDPASVDLNHLVPTSVPSGLPVAD